MTLGEYTTLRDFVENAATSMDPNIGFSVSIWKLEDLLMGYQYALDNGYHDDEDALEETQGC